MEEEYRIPLTSEDIFNAVYEGDKPGDVIVFDELESTNSYLMAKGEEFNNFTVVIAKRQTKGKGRLSRSFYSPECGLYMSVLLRPDILNTQLTYITPSVAVAVSQAIEKVFGIAVGIKWVNDIIYRGKKVCGILTEASIDPLENKPRYVVVGIGVNVFTPEGGFPDEIKDIAGCLSDSSADRVKFIHFICEIIHNIRKYCQGEALFNNHSEYVRRSVVMGKRVSYSKNGGLTCARVAGITDAYSLLLETDNSGIDEIASGEISIRAQDLYV
ncbi:MAG: biotin--[acetyl-CoA-carboxylase] ligase [Clostridiales bacterium]|nr:biotin--[acetyl-CoA-carboxylase] ligase [Clostridiales bacterium]